MTMPDSEHDHDKDQRLRLTKARLKAQERIVKDHKLVIWVLVGMAIVFGLVTTVIW